MGEDHEHGWRVYSPLASDESRRIEPEETRHADREPVATVEIRIFDWAPGQAELRFASHEETQDEQWRNRLVDAAIRELHRMRRTLSDGGW